jgi:hypothetical protein
MSRQQRLTLLAAICGSAVATIDAIVQLARHYGAYDIRSLAQAVHAAGACAALAA